MVGLIVLRDYSHSITGRWADLVQGKDKVIKVSAEQTYADAPTQAELEAIPEADVVAWLADQQWQQEMSATDREWNPRMAEDLFALAVGGKTLADLRVENGGELPIEAWINKREAKRTAKP